jgi:ribosomal protein L20A (L18A)
MHRGVDDCRRYFGKAAGIWQFTGSPREFAREVRAAIRLEEADAHEKLYRRLGQEPPPPDAIL